MIAERRMTKVLIISTVGLIYDGITSVIVSNLQEMSLKELDIYVAATIDMKPGIKKQIENCGCKIVGLPNRRIETLKYFFALISFLKSNHIDILHAHGNSGTLAIEMLAGFLGGCRKRIAHSHNTKCDQVKADRALRPIFNLLYTDGLACGEAAGKWLFGSKRFDVITNGRNVEKYAFDMYKRNTIREQLGIGNEIVIGHVGGFFEQKNHMFLIEIYHEIKNIEPDSKMILIGDGPLKEDVEKISCDPDIIFTGAVDNVQDYLNAMDGMVFPSLFEGLPLVVIEWQINGLPVVMSDCITKECQLTENVEFMSLNLSPRQWAMKILEMIKNSDRMKDAIAALNDVSGSSFDIKVSSKKLERIYRGDRV